MKNLSLKVTVSALSLGTMLNWCNFKYALVVVLTTSIRGVAGTYPRITGRAFVARIMKMSECSASAFVVGAIYLERLRQHDESVMLSMGTFRRLFLVSVMLAAKFLDDQNVSNRQVSFSAYASNEACTRG